MFRVWDLSVQLIKEVLRMSKVQRYTVGASYELGGYSDMEIDEEGEYVRYEDYEVLSRLHVALLEKYEELKEELKNDCKLFERMF